MMRCELPSLSVGGEGRGGWSDSLVIYMWDEFERGEGISIVFVFPV